MAKGRRILQVQSNLIRSRTRGIDWRSMLTRHRIQFMESGPNTAKDNLYIVCPWCGPHVSMGPRMGISLKGEGWGCWRNPKHRGKSPSRLLSAILRIPQGKARELLGESIPTEVEDDDLVEFLSRTFNPVGPGEVQHPRMPGTVRPLWEDGRRRDLFVKYLARRGYPASQVDRVARRYRLHYATQGAMRYRVVIPIYDSDDLVTLTGRAISPNAQLRYLTLSTDPDSRLLQDGMPLAYGPITDYLFCEQRLVETPPETIVVCEGPFDAIRVDWAHHVTGLDVGATCLFGKAVSNAQADRLAMLADRARYRFLLLDPDARFDALEVMGRLETFGFKPVFLPDTWDDPGDPELPLHEIRRIVREEIKRMDT